MEPAPNYDIIYLHKGVQMYNLLIVDDEPLVRRGIKTLVDFKELSIDQVFEAENGEQALKIYKEQNIQLILADINMPKMNGLDFAKAVKSGRDGLQKSGDGVQIALITGYDYFDYAIAALKAGVDDYVLKPVSKKDITQVLLGLIEKHKTARQQVQIREVVTNMTNSEEVDGEDYKTQLKSIIDEEFNNAELTLTFVADSIGLSTGYLSVLFKRLFGLSFQDYVMKYRFDKAKLLLLTTDLKNYEIAEAIGFDDPNYFSTRFKKLVGCSPKQYKQISQS